MMSDYRRWALMGGVFLMLLITSAGSCLCGDFELRIKEFPGDLLPGVMVQTRIEAANSSGHKIVFPTRDDVQIEVRREDGARVQPCPVLDPIDLVEALPADWKGRILAPDWRREFKQMLCFESAGRYSVRYFMQAHGPYRNENGEDYDAWEGEVTLTRTVVVQEPEEIDREVFEAFDIDSLFLGEHSPEILQRFPNSTYAAYVIWERWAKGTAAGWKSDQGRDAFLSSLDNDPSFEYLTWKLPCNAGGDPNPMTITRFHMPEAARCRDAWLGKALVYHPDIWFADELRLKLALDAYLLNDKAACASKLEDLSAHAKPYVAKKARALLEAMQSKNMLPGGPKDLTATPAKTEPEGKTDQ